MRVTRKFFFFPEVLRLEELSPMLAGEHIEQESIAEAFNNVIFKFIEAGVERTCIILKAEGFSIADISWMLGIDRIEVHRTIYKVRNRLLKLNLKKYVQNPTLPVPIGLSNGRNNLTK